MDIKRTGSQPSTKGPADWFTGAVRIDPLFQRAAQRGGRRGVTFEPGARTAWHTHPLGQTLIVTAGLRPGAARGRPDRGDPARRRRLVFRPARSTGTAPAHHRHDAHRHPGSARRQGGRVDGEGQRRAISGLSSCFANLD